MAASTQSRLASSCSGSADSLIQRSARARRRISEVSRPSLSTEGQILVCASITIGWLLVPDEKTRRSGRLNWLDYQETWYSTSLYSIESSAVGQSNWSL